MTTSAPSAGPTARRRGAALPGAARDEGPGAARWARAATVAALAACAVVLAMEVWLFLRTASRPFDGEPHAWGSAHFATIARSYVRHGIVALRGLPIVNNPPLGDRPDVYVHWPPLFGILLGRAFAVWGESERVARTLAAVIALASVPAFWFLGRSFLDRRGAALGTLAYATVPAFVVYARLVQANLLCIALGMVALGAFLRAVAPERLDRRWAALGLVAHALAVAAWWGDGALLGVPLLVAGAASRSRRVVRLALAYVAVAAVTAAAFMAGMLVAAPAAAAELWATVVFRATGTAGEGLRSGGLHTLPSRLYYTFNPGWGTKLAAYGDQAIALVGWVGLGTLAVAAFLAARGRRERGASPGLLAAAGTCGVWGLWYLLMSNQAADNDFQMLLAAPAVGVAAGFAGTTLLRARSRRALAAGAVAAVALLLVVQTAALVRKAAAPYQPSGLVEFAREIRDATPPDAIVLVASPSMVPVYYSDRHVIRGIADGAAVQEATALAAREYPRSPVYLAVEPRDVDPSSPGFASLRVAHLSPALLLVKLRAGG